MPTRLSGREASSDARKAINLGKGKGLGTSHWEVPLLNEGAKTNPTPTLTTEGRNQLEQKSRSLLEALTTFRFDASQSTSLEDAESYEAILNEFVQLSHAIHSSNSVEDVPDDPGLVLLGDEVVVSAGVANINQYLVVHPVEADLGSGRISSESPLGNALLGRFVGDTVVLDGSPITILRASRKPPAQGPDT